MATPDNNTIIFAPNIHTGGGLTLLRSLIEAWPRDQACLAFLDQRARYAFEVPGCWAIIWCEPSIIGRSRAEWRLMQSATAASVVLCFHNLPPLLPIAGRKLCLVQNRNVLEPSGSAGMNIRVRLRAWIEHLFARWLGGRIDRYFVQTPTMARAVALLRRHSAIDVVVAPFAEPLDRSTSAPRNGAPRWDFIYVADGQAHKNHRRLIRAWQLLAQCGLRPSLVLTLGPRDGELAAELLRNAAGLEIVNLGELSRADVLALYRDARALVFPSTVESFGLPLVEASALGLPILAAELDYVRDVCVPAQSFDPLSAISIARAVRRFLGEPEPPVAVEDPHVFAARILAETTCK